ncbi:hypothetical protein V492_06729 [Pseudogymnoascus sp. VKM F-4246]|nr:hypothetical protein V492_06729 [Pseudogymnoascus sp. VKM F-4246]
MERNGYARPPGPMATGEQQGRHGSSRGRVMPFSVQEALAHSPMSSVVPFNTGIVPLPIIGDRASASIFATPEEENAAREGLAALDGPTSESNGTSQRLGKALSDLQQLLRPEGITQFKFKTAPNSGRSKPDNPPPTTQLSTFAQMLLDRTTIGFEPSMPDAPEPQFASGNAGHVPPKPTSSSRQKSTKRSSVKHSQSKDAHSHHQPVSENRNHTPVVNTPMGAATPHSMQTHNPRIITPPKEPSEIAGSRPLYPVAIHDVSQSYFDSEYAVENESIHSPTDKLTRKRKLSVDDVLEGPDQREQADVAFRELQDHLHSVFESEGNPDGPGLCEKIGEDNVTSLTSPALSKVHILLQKIISLGRLPQVPVGDLTRLQKLCDGAIKATSVVSLRFDDTWEESDMETFLENLAVADIGLKSARASLRIMTGGREEKQLYSEEVIQASVHSLNNVLDSCVVPIVELRDSGSQSSIFKLLSTHKKTIRDVVLQCVRVLSLLRDLVSSIELSETVINTLEYTVSRLIFVENAHSEKDSVLGVAKFDNLRVVAMDTLAQIFSSYTEQRQGIFDEILTSLEKLPVAKQSARQFKLASGGSIQLVSALMMRLIQTSANKSNASSRANEAQDEEEEDADGEADEPGFQIFMGDGPVPAVYDTEPRAARQSASAVHELQKVVQPLLKTAKASASYVVNFIVQRAMTSTKTGDAPYRNLLDLFVQDFITCLNSMDWPAAELLLRIFLINMVNLAEADKTPPGAKNMALDLLGEMGAAISKLTSDVRKLTESPYNDGADEVDGLPFHVLSSYFENKLHAQDLVNWGGPYCISLQYLDDRYGTDSILESAVGYYTADWASQLCASYDAPVEDAPDRDEVERNYGRVAYRLRMMINDKRWLSTEYSAPRIEEVRAKLAYSLTLLNSPFCKASERVLMILLKSMSSDQAIVRSKSLKSVNQVLETDPAILDRGETVIRLILNCLMDTSVQVRDSALGLITKCIGLRPALEKEALPAILRAVIDSNAGVRKRAIKLIKDVYLRNTDRDIRSLIADALLHRAKDLDESVQELARQVIEEIWLSPFYGQDPTADDAVQRRLAITDHVTLMVKTIQRSSDIAGVLDRVLQSSLSGTSKNAAANFKVCKTFVATMFETIIGDAGLSGPDRLETKDALQLLMTFAKADSKLFTTDQIQLLQPFIADAKTETDITTFRCVIVIFRHVFPQLSTLHSPFLVAVRQTILPTVSRMHRAALDDIFACLRIISEVLKNTDNLARLICSTIDNIRKLGRMDFSDPKANDNVRKISKLFLITGMCGKHCDLDSQIALFRQKFPHFKGTSVSKLMVDTFAPFASPSQPLEIRRAALDAIGLVCQSWPKNYDTASISTAFQAAFEDKIQSLESVVMGSFKEFFLSEEKRSDPDAEPNVGAGVETVATLGVMGGSRHDGVSTYIYQKFMPYLTQIALATQDDHALLATEILTSINRQGLNHPKECMQTFVALETSQNSTIAKLGLQEHRSLHEKHETILEKEYTRAVQLAFTYQHDVVKDTRGAISSTGDPSTAKYTAKLHLLIDVLNISKVKIRKRFFESLCTRIDFDQSKLDATGDLPTHVDFSRFVIENLAFCEYATVDELLAAISAMEKIVTGTGSNVAHAIETEIFSLRMENGQAETEPGQEVAPAAETVIDLGRLRQLTAGSMVLSCLWEARTHLRRLYGLMNSHNSRREGKTKGNIKDLNRAPTKVPFASGDKFWDESTRIMSSLGSREAMMDQCKEFVELLTVDKDFKIAAEGEDDVAAQARLRTPSDDDEASQPPSGSGRGRKRKASGTPGGRKKGARSNSKGRSKKNKRGSPDSDEDDDYGS